jgi:hypothetical protein
LIDPIAHRRGVANAASVLRHYQGKYRLWRLDATDQDIEAAARLTGAHDFIVKMEHGYDEQVWGRRGIIVGRAKAAHQSGKSSALRSGDIHHG